MALNGIGFYGNFGLSCVLKKLASGFLDQTISIRGHAPAIKFNLIKASQNGSFLLCFYK
jgi:hypothetical protein